VPFRSSAPVASDLCQPEAVQILVILAPSYVGVEAVRRLNEQGAWPRIMA